MHLIPSLRKNLSCLTFPQVLAGIFKKADYYPL